MDFRLADAEVTQREEVQTELLRVIHDLTRRGFDTLNLEDRLSRINLELEAARGYRDALALKLDGKRLNGLPFDGRGG